MAARTSRPLRRRAGSREQRERLLIYTQSAVPDPRSLSGLPVSGLPGRQRRDGPSVVFGTTHGEPVGLVRAAISHKRREARAGDAFSQVWCVFDAASPGPRADLAEALQLAERHGIRCATSAAS